METPNLTGLLEQRAADESTMARHGLDCVPPDGRDMAVAMLEHQIDLTEKAKAELSALKARIRELEAENEALLDAGRSPSAPYFIAGRKAALIEMAEWCDEMDKSDDDRPMLGLPAFGIRDAAEECRRRAGEQG